MSGLLFNATLVVAIITFLQKIKESKLQHITLERRNWRERLRNIVPELLKNCVYDEEEKNILMEELYLKKKEILRCFPVVKMLEILKGKKDFDISLFEFMYELGENQIRLNLIEELLIYIKDVGIKKIKEKNESLKAIEELKELEEVLEGISLLQNLNYLTIKNLEKNKQEKVVEILNSLYLSLNPNNGEDEYLKKEIKRMLKFKIVDREEFTLKVSELLKQEWDKGKFEASTIKEFIFLIIIFLLVSGVRLLNINNIDSLGLMGINIIIVLTIVYMIYKEEIDKKIKVKKRDYLLKLIILACIAFNIVKLDKFYNEKTKKQNDKKDQLVNIIVLNKENLNLLKKNHVKDVLNNNLNGNKIIGNSSEMENNLIKELKVTPSFSFNDQDRKNIKNEKKIYFDFDESKLTPSGAKLIDEIIKDKKANEKIILFGGTDTVGTTEYNYLLKNKRLNTVKKALINKGIQPKDIEMIPMTEEFIKTEEQVKEPLNKVVKVILKKQ